MKILLKPDTVLWKLANRLCYSVLFKIVSPRRKFLLIHKLNLWSSHESLSGPGSELRNTQNVRNFIAQVISDYQVRSLLDVPCGDFNWMKTMDLSDILYVGVDIVPEIVAENNKQYSCRNIDFRVLDILVDVLPASELILVRDLFIHFSLKNIWVGIDNIRKSGAGFVLTTTFPDSKLNIKIRDGFNFNLNLEIAPFNFGPPLASIIEETTKNGERKCLALWRVQDLPDPSSGRLIAPAGVTVERDEDAYSKINCKQTAI